MRFSLLAVTVLVSLDSFVAGFCAIPAGSSLRISLPNARKALTSGRNVSPRKVSLSNNDFDPDIWIEEAKKYSDTEVTKLALVLFHKHIEKEKLQAALVEKEKLAEKEKEKLQKLAEKEKEKLQALLKEKKQIIKLADKRVIELKKQAAAYEEKDLQARAALVATLANRNLIEIGLRSYGVAQSFTQSHKHFYANVLVDSKNRLRPAPAQTLKMLFKISKTTPDERSVVKELFVLEHQLSKKLHNLDSTPRSTLDGILIGGNEPLASALALYVAELQRLKHLSSPVTVINKDYKASCRIFGGTVRALQK